ncbi:MAG: flagellar basal body P-ring formation protein FlgA [Syntrophaceae bacterium]|nr:flagellar basal body P-ring formation protein FlgA [Syntrophaceae bacterium]
MLIVIGLVMLLCPALVSASVEKGHTYDLGELIKQYVEDNASWSPEDIRIEFTAKLPEVTLKGEKISYEISQCGKDSLVGNSLFSIRFFDDGIQIEKYQVRVNIEIQERYLASNRIIKRHTIIEPSDLQVLRRWVRIPSLKSISDADEIIGKKLIMAVGPGREIKRNMLKEPILVKRGEVVRIVLEHGQMSLLATGVAEEEGVDRQRIRVKNLSSQKVIAAKVMAPGLVKVELF